MERHIVAIGGGDLSEDPASVELNRFILDLSGAQSPRVCFIGTASGDDDSYAERFYSSFSATGCRLSRLTLLKSSARPAEEILAEQDVVYVGGGNAFHMLVMWRNTGLDVHLRRSWERGTVMCGTSAGSMCWFEVGLRQVSESEYRPLRSFLGFLPGSHSPHYNSQPDRRLSYLNMVQDGTIPPGYAAEDGSALHFSGTTLAEVITFAPSARAFRVEPGETSTREIELPSRSLS